MALIPPFFLDAVVAVGFPGPAGPEWVASGFLYGRYMHDAEEAGKKIYSVYFVTNRHVLAEQKAALLRFNPELREPARDYTLNLVDPAGTSWWVPHPDPDIDVAVGPINVSKLKEDGIRYSYFHSDETSLRTAAAADAGLSEGDGVFVLGFPMGLVGVERSYVISRGGSLARVRDWLGGAEKHFLIDAGVFPGNSGGPVVVRPELLAITGTKPIHSANLIGVVRGYVPYRDVAVSEQTRNPRVIFEENSGLAVVHSVDQIEEAIDAAIARVPTAGEDVAAATEEAG